MTTGIGAGISAQLGIATESPVGTPVAVTRFVEFDSETITPKLHTVQGEGLRAGAFVKRAQRRFVVAREFQGDLSFDVPTKGFGLWLQHMMGSFTTTPTSLGGGLYRQIHNLGSVAGKSFTTQVVRPQTNGTLDAYTYTGCKLTGWELSVQQGEQVKAKLTVDALDGATPENAFAPTTLAAAATAGAASVSATASVPAGSYVVLDALPGTREVVQVASVSGSGPYTLTLAAPLQFAHASAAAVSSATGVNYGAAVGMQAASYDASTELFTFAKGALVLGGSTAAVSGVWTNTGGTTVANLRSIDLKGSRPMKVDRWGFGSQVRSEQIENNWHSYTAELEAEYNTRAWREAYVAGIPMSVALQFQGFDGTRLAAYFPVGFQNDGTEPNVSGPDIMIPKLQLDLLDDGVNGALQFVYDSFDTTV